ncbi:hypothetical protein BC832DRAFT_546150 [Gaertneriomyces semiglobifer]|nr:hypothetical protein BC832DRAFT_546150 [Gaertneriomyces semiglobifer]
MNPLNAPPSLQEANPQASEPDPALLDSFKAAAASVTQLYRESVKTQRRAYQQGYSQCLQDLWQFVGAQRGQQRDGVAITELVSFFARKYEQLQSASTANVEADNGQMQVRREEAQPKDEPHRTLAEQHQPPENVITSAQPPSSNFTFTPPTPVAYAGYPQNPPPTSLGTTPSAWVPAVHEMHLPSSADGEESAEAGVSLKRRWGQTGQNEVQFLGRAFNWGDSAEPIYKRPKWRRDDQMSD